jgi:hypothetical protein
MPSTNPAVICTGDKTKCPTPLNIAQEISVIMVVARVSARRGFLFIALSPIIGMTFKDKKFNAIFY